jgi:Zn-dependent protease
MSFFEIVLAALGLIVAVTIHECAHAFIATKLGDPTPKVEGRVSLNPGVHLDIMGTIFLVLTGFGWGKPVEIQPRYFKNPTLGTVLTALAGPGANFVCAFLLATVLAQFRPMPLWLSPILMAILNVNLWLGLFNFLPLPPLDGSKLLLLFLPRSWREDYERFLEHGSLYTMLFLLFDVMVLSRILPGGSLISHVLSPAFAVLKGLFFLQQ